MSIYTVLQDAVFGQPMSYASDVIMFTIVLIFVMSIWDGIIDIVTTLIKKV